MLVRIEEIVGKEKPDALVVSGDVYHTGQPSAAVQKMFTEGLSAADAVNELQDGINKWAEQNANVLEAYKIWVVK